MLALGGGSGLGVQEGVFEAGSGRLQVGWGREMLGLLYSYHAWS